MTGALPALLDEKASQLQAERRNLQEEARQLWARVNPVEQTFDANALKSALQNFDNLANVASPERLQQLLRMMVKKIDWRPDRSYVVQFPSSRETEETHSDELLWKWQKVGFRTYGP